MWHDIFLLQLLLFFPYFLLVTLITVCLEEVSFWSCLFRILYIDVHLISKVWNFFYYLLKRFIMPLAYISFLSSILLAIKFGLLILSQSSCISWSWSFIFIVHCMLSVQVHISYLQCLKFSFVCNLICWPCGQVNF